MASSASSAAVSRKRRKAPLTSDAKTRCPAKRSLTQPSPVSQSILSQLSMKPATSGPASMNTTGITTTSGCTTSLCEVCKQLTSSTSIGTDSLQCCMCGLIFHGECLSIKSAHLPYLYIVVDIGGWCCTKCRSPGPPIVGAKVALQQPVLPGSNLAQVNLTDLKAGIDDIKDNLKMLHDDLKKIAAPSYASVVNKPRTKSIAPDSQDSTTDADITTDVPINVRSMISTIHSEMKAVNRRSTNVIVSGLKPRSDMSDVDLIKDLCFTHLTIAINVVTTRRLGKNVSGKTQLLLVQLDNSSTVTHLLQHVRSLRSSNDPYVRDHVYVNAHLSSEERKEAYLKRLQRRSASGASVDGSSSVHQSGATRAPDRINAVNNAGGSVPPTLTIPVSNSNTASSSGVSMKN